MGVTDLWSVLDQVKEHLPLSSLRGQRLAVDLSIWICESQGTRKMEGVITKPFLRNIFFRASHLLQLGIDLIFIIDGRAPEIKAETMHKRQNGRLMYGKSLQNNFRNCKSTKRSNLNAAVKECCELLDYLGVPYLESEGEAEAYCAFLNKNGVVDACLTNDGDAFLYGAKRVYRNFTMDRKDPHVESYTMQDIKRQLSFNQEKLVAFALLTGCDYQPKGVPHVGVETALKLFMAITDKDVLLRFRQWRSMKPSDCCCAIEMSVWEKACRVPEFPSEQIIEEFLISKDVLPKKNLQWKSPNMMKFQNFMFVKLEWLEDYAVQKVLPLLTRWIMLEMIGLVTTKTRGLHLTPVKILKNRVCKGVLSVEVEWKISGSSEDTAYVTIEDKEMVSQCFPHLLEQFSQELNKNTKTKTVSKIKIKKEKTGQKENSGLDNKLLLLSLNGLNLGSNKQDIEKCVGELGEKPFIKKEASMGTFACEQVSTSLNDEPIRNCLSSACHLQTQQPSSNTNVTNFKCIDIDSSHSNTSEDEYLPLKERIKNTRVQTQKHKPKKEMSLIPSFINSNKPETDSEIAKPLELFSKSGNRILNSASISTCSSIQQTNTMSDTTGINGLINLTRKSYLEIDSSNDEDFDDSLFLPISHKLLNRYQISCESENEDSFHSDQCLLLNLSQAPCDKNVKPNHCERLEELDRRTEFSGNLSAMSAEHFGNSQLLSNTDEIAEEFFMLNVNDEVDTLSSNYSGILSMASPHLYTDVIKGSPSTDATQLCTDVVKGSFSIDATQLCTDVIGGSPSSDATQLCTDVVEGSCSIDATQLCTDVIDGSFGTVATQVGTDAVERSFSTDATQVCTDAIEGSFSTDATQVCTDAIEGSFSTDATQVCTDAIEGSFSTDATQVCTDAIEGSFSTDATQVCTDAIEGSFSTDATQVCTDAIEGSFSTDATQVCTDAIEGSFSTDATQVCTDAIEGSFSTDATQVCTDAIEGSFSTDATQVCTDAIEGSFSTDATQVCTDAIEGSFSTDATQVCTDAVESSFSTDATQVCTDAIEGSFSTVATQVCTDTIDGLPSTTNTTLLSRGIVKDFSQTNATQPLAENQSIHLPIKDKRTVSTNDTRDFFVQNTHCLSNDDQCSSVSPNLKTSSAEALRDGNCNNTISKYSINREENVSLHFINSSLVNTDISYISNHLQSQEDSSVLFMKNKISIIEKTKGIPMSSDSIMDKLGSNLSYKNTESIIIEDDDNDAIDFVNNNPSSADQTFKNSSLLSNHCLNQTKIETASQHILHSDFNNLSESQSDMAVLHNNSGVNTTAEFHVPKTPEDASFIHELFAFNKDLEEDLIPYSSFEDHSSIMDVYNLTPDSLHSFSESRVGNFELISSLLDNSSEFKLDSDSAKTSKDVLKTSMFNTRTNFGYKNQMEIKYPCRKNSLTNLNKNSCFTLSRCANSIETSTPSQSSDNETHSSYNKTVCSNEVSTAVDSYCSPVLPANLSTGLNNKLFSKYSKESISLENENTKFQSHYEENISSSSGENIYNCQSQTPPQQEDSPIYDETSYLSCFQDSFSKLDITNTITPKLSNKNNSVKCWDYLNISFKSQDNSVNLLDDTFDEYKSSFKMKTDVDLKDNCNVDDSKLESKPNPESPLPLIMRLGHFNVRHMKK